MRAVVIAALAITLCVEVKCNFCYNDVTKQCNTRGQEAKMVNCDAKYSGAKNGMNSLNSYVHEHIVHNFQFLRMYTNFANFEQNREGFAKLFKKLSDSTWHDAIDLVKYISKRGGTVDLQVITHEEPNKSYKENYEMHELESLSRALDMQKALGESAHKIHAEMSARNPERHDAETMSYIEKEFVHKHAQSIRELAGHANDLKNLIAGAGFEPSLSIFLFDDYLKKTL